MHILSVKNIFFIFPTVIKMCDLCHNSTYTELFETTTTKQGIKWSNNNMLKVYFNADDI